MSIQEIKERLIAAVDPIEVWKHYFSEYVEGKCVKCVFHDDDKPSLSLSANGAGLCHACGWKCSSVVGFITDKEKVPFKRALRKMRRIFTDEVVPSSDWLVWHEKLSSPSMKSVREKLMSMRGITNDTVEKYRLGWNKSRLTIPIFDELKDCVNVRMHDALRACPAGSPKMLSYRQGKGNARLYPLSSLDAKHTKIYIFEGELNTLLALKMGLNAVCATGGARTWNDEWADYFGQRKVVVCQDVNDADNAGQEGAEKKCKAIARVAQWVKNVKLPIQDKGGDFIDYVMKHGHTLNDFMQLELATAYYQPPAEEGKQKQELDYSTSKYIRLKESAHPENFGKAVIVKCLVASMDLAPFVPPRKVLVTCKEFASHQAAGKIPPKCGACWMPEAGLQKELEFGPEQRELIAILEKNDARMDHGLRKMSDVPLECDVVFDIKDVHNTHMIGVVPDVSSERTKDGRHDYVSRTGYFFGKHIEANKAYELTGFSTNHPDTQQVTHVFVKAQSALSEIDEYKISKEDAGKLTDLLSMDSDPYDKLMDIYKDFSSNITKIIRRPLLHAALDLVWHSPLQFKFNGEQVNKGWLEAMVFGDTRCGKGFVAEGLARHYGLGEIVSGENCSFAGLVGGLETMGKRLVLRWGAIPLNDRGLVIIDEFSGMNEDVFGRMSRVRSEGIAEVTKIGHHQKTLARTRLIWICNPKEGTMADYTYGVQALQNICDKAEDISRFDYAFAVTDDEVPPDAINTSYNHGHSKTAYPSELCRALIHWVWSRKAHQIQFTERATQDILHVHSKELAVKYSPVIPLIQGQNIRIKLAKMSAAVAGRLFRHKRGDIEVLVVDSQCAATAARLVDEFYKSSSMQYDAFSRKMKTAVMFGNSKELRHLFDVELGKNSLPLVRCLLTKRISVKVVAASARMDKMEAEQKIMDVLLRENAVNERANGYFGLTAQFKSWLEHKERELESRHTQGAIEN